MTPPPGRETKLTSSDRILGDDKLDASGYGA